MARDNISQFILLGLLSIKPMSGYDLRTYITDAVRYFWTMSFGQIYPALKKFVDAGWATYITDREEGRPEKKIYFITDEGRRVLRAWLQEPLDFESGNCGMILTIKVYFGASAGKEITIGHIESLMRYTQKQLHGLEHTEREMLARKEHAQINGDSSYTYRLCTLMEGMSMMRAQIDWCQSAIKRIRQDAPEHTEPSENR